MPFAARPHRWCGAVRRAVLLAVALAFVHAGPAAAGQPHASFTVTPEHPVAGKVAQLTSTTTSDHPESEVTLEWDLDDDGAFDDATGREVSHTFASAGTHTVRLRATTPFDGSTEPTTDVATRAIAVDSAPDEPPPAPPPATTPTVPEPPANQPPLAAFDRGCVPSAGFVLCSGLFAREQRPHTIDASPSHDPDGHIARYEWDLDGNGSFETDTGATPAVTHTFTRNSGLVDNRKRDVHLRVTDDRGATATAGLRLSLLEPSCEPLMTSGRIRLTGLCLRHLEAKRDGETFDRWYSERPVKLNGISIVPRGAAKVVVDLPRDAGKPAVSAYDASVTIPTAAGEARIASGRVRWHIAGGKTVEGFDLASDARLNGLKISGLAHAPELQTDGTSRIAANVALPDQFGGASSDEPLVFSPGKATAAASKPLEFRVANAAIGPIGLEELVVSFDGDGLWQIGASVALPEPIPYTLSGDAGIRDGKFEHAGAAVDFGTPGIGPFGPVFIQRIAFRVEVSPKKSKCVPKVGIEKFPNRKIVHDITGIWYDIPEYLEVDHGIPTLALCGEVGLTAGPQILGAAAIRLDAGLGFATYDDRPAVFRAFGKVALVEIPLAKASFELHTNGYTRMRADIHWGIPHLASLDGFVMFEMLAPKFNAMAYIQACVEFIDFCAGAKGIVSSKGVAVCLRIGTIFGDWEPGFGYVWGEAFPDLYFTGCDVGDYKEHINSGTTRSGGRARMQVAGSEQAIDLPDGLPGATVVARGAGAPPQLTLIGPNGERVSTPQDNKALQQGQFLVMKDPRANLTQFAIAKPAAGRWRVVVDEGSAAVQSLQSAEGIAEPEVSATVRGEGRRRTIAYKVKPIAGQKVSFVERGPSAGNLLGTVGDAEGELSFTPAPGEAEQREIVAQIEQDGHLREERVVARYRAPAAQRPGTVRGLRVVRRGSRLRVSWRRTAGADMHEVVLRLVDGQRRLFLSRRAAVTVRGVRRGLRGSVAVHGVTNGGLRGPTQVTRLR